MVETWEWIERILLGLLSWLFFRNYEKFDKLWDDYKGRSGDEAKKLIEKEEKEISELKKDMAQLTARLSELEIKYEKCANDIATIKHEFNNLQVALRPILRRMAEEPTISEMIIELRDELRKNKR